LREDPDLGTGIPDSDRNWAVEQCVVPALSIAPGDWDLRDIQDLTQGIGVLILDGLLLRRVGVDGRFGGELVGEGDLLRPWEGEDVDSTLPYSTGWRALSRTRLAVLDGRATARMCRYPTMIGAITGRALERARRLALMMAIIHHPRIDVRLHMLFWHLADRWGRVGRDGVILEMGLSHTVLADLIAAQRPSVTGSLKKLSESGLIESTDRGWVLTGEPPGELLQIQKVSVPDAEPAQSPTREVAGG
jgi:CRP-like cAMP-binding protein